MEIQTYPEMDVKIKDILRIGGSQSGLYAAQRIEELEKEIRQLTEIIARNLVAWDTSKDKREGFLPEVYLRDKYWYKKLTGEEYYHHKAVKKFGIE